MTNERQCPTCRGSVDVRASRCDRCGSTAYRDMEAKRVVAGMRFKGPVVIDHIVTPLPSRAAQYDALWSAGTRARTPSRG